MYCPNCGKEIAEKSKFCMSCGTSLVRFLEQGGHDIHPDTVLNEPEGLKEQRTQNEDIYLPGYPTMCKLACPTCGSSKFKVLGIEGSIGRSLLTSGVIGNFVMDQKSKTDYEDKLFDLQCLDCRSKFKGRYSLTSDKKDLLEKPCKIFFTRISAFIGSAASIQVFLNGVKVGNVNNGQTIAFETNIKRNVLFITDQFGNSGYGMYWFDAENGCERTVYFKRGFINMGNE